jgi:hypothetical protein
MWNFLLFLINFFRSKPKECPSEVAQEPFDKVTFVREMDRYVVIKSVDLNVPEFTPEMARNLAEITNTIEKARFARLKPPLKCVVVESDWPEYEPTWKAIEARVNAETEVRNEMGLQPADNVPDMPAVKPAKTTSSIEIGDEVAVVAKKRRSKYAKRNRSSETPDQENQ